MIGRLQRLLLVVPAVRAKPGIELSELAGLLQCGVVELREDITLLSMVGAPPFDPDDLIDLSIVNDRVHLHLAPAFERPTRLVATEAAALVSACRALAPSDDALAGAIRKIEDAVVPMQRAIYDALVSRIAAVPESESPEVIATCERAIRERRLLDLDYFARSDLSSRTRRVRPRAIASFDGVRYLCARNELGEERTYRIERIVAARITDEPFQPPPPIDLDAFVERAVRVDQSAELPRATVRFSGAVAEAARVRHPDAVETGTGAIDALVTYSTLPWLVSYALSWGGSARVVAPADAREAFDWAVKSARERHASPM